MTTTERALAILRDAQREATELASHPRYSEPVWGPWNLRADQRTIYESAVERAIEALERSDDDEDWPEPVRTDDVAGGGRRDGGAQRRGRRATP